MSDEERAWLPTHLQQAEKVLDKQSAPAKDVPRETRRRRKLVGRRKSGKPTTFTSIDRATVDLFEKGKAYSFDVHNSLTNIVRRVKGMTFQKADANGVLWFVDDKGNQRYFRPGAIFKVKGEK